MKKNINLIITGVFLLFLFPFLGFPEFYENMYIILVGFLIGYAVILLRHKSGIVDENEDENSLQEYVLELRNRFRNSSDKPVHLDAKKPPLSKLNVDHE